MHPHPTSYGEVERATWLFLELNASKRITWNRWRAIWARVDFSQDSQHCRLFSKKIQDKLEAHQTHYSGNFQRYSDKNGNTRNQTRRIRWSDHLHVDVQWHRFVERWRQFQYRSLELSEGQGSRKKISEISKTADIKSSETPAHWIGDSWKESWEMYDPLQWWSCECSAFIAHDRFSQSAQYLRSNRGLVWWIGSAHSWSVGLSIGARRSEHQDENIWDCCLKHREIDCVITKRNSKICRKKWKWLKLAK